jgi:hypothetical protein
VVSKCKECTHHQQSSLRVLDFTRQVDSVTITVLQYLGKCCSAVKLNIG